jgi:hypothetical protein
MGLYTGTIAEPNKLGLDLEWDVEILNEDGQIRIEFTRNYSDNLTRLNYSKERSITYNPRASNNTRLITIENNIIRDRDDTSRDLSIMPLFPEHSYEERRVNIYEKIIDSPDQLFRGGMDVAEAIYFLNLTKENLPPVLAKSIEINGLIENIESALEYKINSRV